MENEKIKATVYSTKLYPGTIQDIKALAQAGKIQTGENYGERQVIEEMVEAYRQVRPDRFAIAERYKTALADLKNNAPDEPLEINYAAIEARTLATGTKPDVDSKSTFADKYAITKD